MSTYILMFVIAGLTISSCTKHKESLEVTININGVVGPYFRSSRGVRKGDPISPLLFNLAVDVLASILDKARVADHIHGVVGHLIPGGGVTHLQYADDTMIMIEGSDL